MVSLLLVIHIEEYRTPENIFPYSIPAIKFAVRVYNASAHNFVAYVVIQYVLEAMKLFLRAFDNLSF